ncbi:diacylglycerol kinase (ATP) [Spirosomataceae bacterium TFI 002]|nr:diacylglycerol kinase (ATP) [Spirosomataceae bacterium TFI 002]
MKKFVHGRLLSMKYALKGAFLLITTEHSIMVQFATSCVVIGLGFYFDISKQDWINQTLVMAMVLGIESMNTAVEKMADFIHPDFNAKIGFIKDIAAGAVTFCAIAAAVLFALIYFPYFFPA